MGGGSGGGVEGKGRGVRGGGREGRGRSDTAKALPGCAGVAGAGVGFEGVYGKVACCGVAGKGQVIHGTCRGAPGTARGGLLGVLGTGHAADMR